MERSVIPAEVQDGILRHFAGASVSLRKVRLEPRTGKLEDRVLVLTRWRMFLICVRVPVKVENSFNFLEIQDLTPLNVDQLAVETGQGCVTLRFDCPQHLHQLVDHINCALSKIFPAYSPFPSREVSPESLRQPGTCQPFASQPVGCCGGFSETYAALCDYNGVPCREEVQWDVDTIYHSQDCRQFNILDFSHLQSRDLALAVTALAYNPWFNKLHSRDLKLGTEVTEQVIHTLSRSLTIEELQLEGSGLRGDFAQRLASALTANPSTALTAVSLASNPLEDRGTAALSQYLSVCERGLRLLNLCNTSLTSRGLLPLTQALNSNETFTNTLTHLDLSKNAGLLAGEEAAHLYQFLSCPNVLVDLNLGGTDCALDMLFTSLSHGCCSQLTSLNVSQNTFSHRKLRNPPPSFKVFFSSALSLRQINFSGTKLPSEALRALLLGLASNPLLKDLGLDLSSCELRSGGARVLEDNVSRVQGLTRIDLSDNGLDADLLTLLPALALAPSVQHLAIGRNFNVRAKTLEEILQTLVQVLQEEGCRITSLSLANSKLRTRGSLVLNALGSNSGLRELDISGNGLGNLGAKMLGKALQVNSTLRTVSWDRNNTTASGFLDVARALESNFTLRDMPTPLSDVSHSHRTDPTRTQEAVHRIHQALLRNNRTHKFSQERSFRLQQGIMGGSAEQMMDRLCVKVDADLWVLRNCRLDSVVQDSCYAQEMLRDARNSRVLFPSLYDLAQRTSHDLVPKLDAASAELTQSLESQLQVLLDSMVTLARDLCPLAARRAETNKKLRLELAGLPAPGGFVRAAVVDQAGAAIHRKVSELTLLLVTSLTNALVDEILNELYHCHKTLVQHIAQAQSMRENQLPTAAGLQDVPAGDREQPDNGTDDEISTSIDTLAVRRHTAHSRRIRPASAYLSVSDLEPDPLTEDETLSGAISSSTTSSQRSRSLEGLGDPPPEGARGPAGAPARGQAARPPHSPTQLPPPVERWGEDGAVAGRDQRPEHLDRPQRRKGRRRGLFRFMSRRGGQGEEEAEGEAEAEGGEPPLRPARSPAREEAAEGTEAEGGASRGPLIHGRPVQGICLPGLAGAARLFNQEPCPGRLGSNNRAPVTGCGRQPRAQLPDPPPPPPQGDRPHRAGQADGDRQQGPGDPGGHRERPPDPEPRTDGRREREPGGAADTDTGSPPGGTERRCRAWSPAGPGTTPDPAPQSEGPPAEGEGDGVGPSMIPRGEEEEGGGGRSPPR